MKTLSESVIQDKIMEINRGFAAQGVIRRWTNMMMEGLIKTNDVIRVEVNDDGTVNLLDFALPTRSGRERKNIPQEDVEKWIMETISMLRIAEINDLVPELGFKLADNMYYILNREGETK